MKKSNIVENSNEVVAAIESSVALPTYEETLALVPAKEHREFSLEDFNAIVDKTFPATVEEVIELAKTLSHGGIFALATKSGKAECMRVAKLFIESDRQLRASAIAGFKSAAGGKSEYFAGCLAYGLISAIKNS